jgi:hypothetical protein
MLKEHEGQHFDNKCISYGEGCLAPCQTPQLEGHPFSALRDCWFSVFAAIHTQPEGAPWRGAKGPTEHGL